MGDSERAMDGGSPAEKPPETVREYFVSELRRRRHVVGLSQEQLARRITYSSGLVSMVESGQRAPTYEFTAACDRELDCDGALLRVWPLLQQDVHPAWFKSFVALESEAVALHEFEVLAVPGLLQTEAYARANLAGSWPPRSNEDLASALDARLDRQRILDRDQPAMQSIVLDESVLLRPVGGPGVMADQLWHLLRMAQRSFIRMLVLPMERSGRISVDGAFTLLELPHNDRVAYVEGPASGRVIVEPDAVERCRLAFDAIRSQALSMEESAELILRTIGERYEPS